MSERFHSLDVSRAILMILGIPFHAGLLFSYYSTWDVSAQNPSWLVTIFSSFTNVFRMPAFFIVAGFFAFFTILKKDKKLWFKARAPRLLLPLVFGALLLNPVQIYVTSLYQYESGGVSNLAYQLYSQFSTFGNQWIRHLWFLIVLFLFSSLLFLFFQRFNFFYRLGFLKNLGFWKLSIFLFIYNFLSYAVAKIFVDSYGSGFTVSVFLNFFVYLPYFFIGGFFGFYAKDVVFLPRVNVIILCIILCFFLPIYFYAQNESGIYFKVITTAIKPVMSLILSYLFFLVAFGFFNRPYAFVGRIVKYSFSIYLIHQPIILVLGFFVWKYFKGWDPVILWVCVSVFCFLLSYVFAALVNQFRILKWMFNGVPLRRVE